MQGLKVVLVVHRLDISLDSPYASWFSYSPEITPSILDCCRDFYIFALGDDFKCIDIMDPAIVFLGLELIFFRGTPTV